MAWPVWHSQIVILQQPFLTIGGGFGRAPRGSGTLHSGKLSWQKQGTGTCLRIGRSDSRPEWRASLSWPLSLCPLICFPTRPMYQVQILWS